LKHLLGITKLDKEKYQSIGENLGVQNIVKELKQYQQKWTQIEYQNKHNNIHQKDEGTYDYRGREGRTNFILRIKEQETHLTLFVHDDDDDD
jgi:hypothetical protein